MITVSNNATSQLENATQVGLTTVEAQFRMQKYGANALPDTKINPLLQVLKKFWAPVPCLLEAAIILELILQNYIGASVIACLLLFNAALGYFQEGKAQATLATLKSRLAHTASVKRDGIWKIMAAENIVPGDIVKLSLGGIVCADVKLISGEILIDQSMITGESMPIEAGAGIQTYAGALIRRGEAVAEVIATGSNTKFGHTAELVLTAHFVSTQQKAVLRIVRNLAVISVLLIIFMVIYAQSHAMPLKEIVLLGLTGILAAIPVALPATFTLAAARGARALAKIGILPTRLSAIDEAASIDVLCADKTGTLTSNQLEVTTVRSMPGFKESDVLAMAAAASSVGGQDLVDAAIHTAAAKQPSANQIKLLKFTPFDPENKMSDALFLDSNGTTIRTIKGSFAAVSKLVKTSSVAQATAGELASKGFRVLSVASGPPNAMVFTGFIALSDPPRVDSKNLVSELKTLGVRLVMVTGDAPETAIVVAREVGLDGPICPPGPIPTTIKPESFSVFAAVLPEDKFALVKAFQKSGHTVGMCGDGVNDAPSLRQAQMGIAVSTASDIAKSAAGIVLTEPGLSGIVASIQQGRIIFQRILTYTINSVRSKIVQEFFLVFGLLLTGHSILTPILMVIIMITGDFLGMSLTTDHVQPSQMPNVWRIGNLTIAGVVIGVAELLYCIAMLLFGKFYLSLNIDALQTLAFITIVFGHQASMYSVRSRGWLWSYPHPGKWVLFSSLADILIASALAIFGLLMAPLSVLVVVQVLTVAIFSAFFVDVIKMPVFRYLKISQKQRMVFKDDVSNK